jgi:hypothetical protein
MTYASVFSISKIEQEKLLPPASVTIYGLHYVDACTHALPRTTLQTEKWPHSHGELVTSRLDSSILCTLMYLTFKNGNSSK